MKNPSPCLTVSMNPLRMNNLFLQTPLESSNEPKRIIESSQNPDQFPKMSNYSYQLENAYFDSLSYIAIDSSRLVAETSKNKKF